MSQEEEQTESVQNRLLIHLKNNHYGCNKAIKAKELKHFGTPRKIRLMVHNLRLQNNPICSDNDGYYYASNEKEVSSVVQRLLHFVIETQEAIKGLTGSIERKK
jgi:glycyl-tRNA synthetase beta subunit